MHEGRGNNLTGPMKRTEERLGRPLGEYLAEQYATRTLAEIATELGITESAVSKWMSRLGLERRFPGQRPAAVA